MVWANTFLGKWGRLKRSIFCSSLVIDTLHNLRPGDQAVTSLYCNSQVHKELSTAHMLGAVLKQVGCIQREIEAAFERSKKKLDGGELESGEILKLLISSLRTMQRSYICIDALDEIPSEYRLELFKSLVQVTQQSPGTRLFLTGRHHIKEEIGTYFTRRAEIQIEPTEQDIRNLLTMGFCNDTEPQAMSPELREEILRTIPEKVPKTYVSDITTCVHLLTFYSLTCVQNSAGFVKHEHNIGAVNYSSAARSAETND